MKKQLIITFIIGALVGAIITAAIFLIAKPKGGRGDMPDFSKFQQDGERQKPDGNFDFDKDGKRPSRSKDSTGNDDNKKVDKDTNEEQA